MSVVTGTTLPRKTVVITGASSGIGMALAPLFAARGYELILTARRIEHLQRLAEDLRKVYGATVHVIQMDIAQPYTGEILWRAISAITPDISVLVNNAGAGDAGDFSDESPEDIERMIQLNVSSLTLLTRFVLPGMLARKRGRILNVSSLAGFQPGGPGMAVYYATKGYVLSFSRGIRRELRGSGVSVTALCPGPTATGFEAAAGAQQTRLFHWNRPMTASEVAQAGYAGMQRGMAVVVPGLRNKLLSMTWLAPDSLVLEINRFLLSARK